MDPLVRACVCFENPPDFRMAAPFTSHQRGMGFLERSVLPSSWRCQCPCFSPSHRCALVSRFNLHFPEDSLVEISPECSLEGLTF